MTRIKLDELSKYRKELNNVGKKYSQESPIVIDFGSWQVRAGFADTDPQLVFDNLVSKTSKGIHIGGGDQCDYSGARSAFDFQQSLIVHPPNLELTLDHVFVNLLKAQREKTLAQRSIVFTETLCNLNQCRGIVSELMFECYSVSRLAYGVDALFSFYYNGGFSDKKNMKSNALIVSSGHNASHIIPVLDGSVDYSHCKRLDIGGRSSTEFMQKHLLVKYPELNQKLSLMTTDQLRVEYCRVASDYKSDLNKFQSDNQFLIDNSVSIQLPFQKYQHTEEQVEAMEERKQLARLRMMERVDAQRREKLEVKQRELERVDSLLKEIDTLSKSKQQPKKSVKKGRLSAEDQDEDMDEGDDEQDNKEDDLVQEQVDQLLYDNDFADVNEVRDHRKDLLRQIKKIEAKLRGEEDGGVDEEGEEQKAPPVFDLVDVPDSELDPEQIKEKRKQKLFKANYDARMRIKAAKEEQQRLAKEKKLAEDRERQNDLQGWLQGIKQRKYDLQSILDKKKKAAASSSSRKRLKTLAKLAVQDSDDNPFQSKQQDDGFGMDDKDWDVYRKVQKENTAEQDADEDEEDQIQTELAEIEQKLMSYDPEYVSEEEKQLLAIKQSLWYKLKFDQDEDQYDYYGIKLSSDRYKVPEILFQPHLMGSESAGLSEMCSTLAKVYESDLDKLQMMSNVFITGGNTMYRGFDQRLFNDLRQIVLCDVPVKVYHAQDSILDAWRGASKWALDHLTNKNQKVFITRKQYEECGADYLQEHQCSNLYINY
ncbi:hypothetical protein MP228_001498 [Amoeboaphelidium protococcarum]|nr:hypothetical protein MP228_001498 [Amoeboaphelidium protococcarum]